MKVILLACMLTGCASFGAPSLHEGLAEQQACSESWACRTFILDRPVALAASIRDSQSETRCALASVGLGGYQYGPYVIAFVDGRQYALGYSWTCDGICSMTEAQHAMRGQ